VSSGSCQLAGGGGGGSAVLAAAAGGGGGSGAGGGQHAGGGGSAGCCGPFHAVFQGCCGFFSSQRRPFSSSLLPNFLCAYLSRCHKANVLISKTLNYKLERNIVFYVVSFTWDSFFEKIMRALNNKCCFHIAMNVF
jgi:hypothetical protein